MSDSEFNKSYAMLLERVVALEKTVFSRNNETPDLNIASNTDREYPTGNLAFGTASNTDRKTFPEGILSIKESMFNTIYIYQKDMDYQSWCATYLSENTAFKNSIHSVKNSKGEVFVVGDEVMDARLNDSHCGKITRFELGEEDVYAMFNDTLDGSMPVDLLTKVKPKELQDDDEYKHYSDKEKEKLISYADLEIWLTEEYQKRYLKHGLDCIDPEYKSLKLMEHFKHKLDIK